MGVIKRALRRTSRKLLSKIIPPTHSHQLVLNPQCSGQLATHQAEQLAGGKRKLSSFQKRFKKSGSSKDTAVAEALLLAVKNHLPPLQFHHIHGPHAQLNSSRSVARRTQSFCQALVFSNRVILPNERVYIKVLEISKCWSGTIRFGFTAVDPATLACRMPKHACPDMTNAGHTWARALADEVVRRNSVIHFSYNKNGIIHYGINNQDCGVFHANVRTSQNLWFIVDIYGLTAAVELIDPRVNNGSNNGINFSPRELAQPDGGHNQSTMYKSTSAMEELFGGRYTGSSVTGRRKKMSRKHARHAAMIQAANWPLDSYAGAYGQHAQHVNQLPNLNSMTLPSAQQNIYSPMPNAAAVAAEQRQTRARNDVHDYHQIMSNTHSYGAYQPLRVATGSSTLSGSISLANIAHAGASNSSGGVATSSRHNEPSASISQADLSHQLESMRLYERRMRKRAAATASKESATANQTPVAAARTRQHLQQINTNQTGNHLRRAPESATRDQVDKSASSSATHRIVSTKSATSSSASTSTHKPASSSHASVKPKARHSIKSQKAASTATTSSASAAADNSDNNPPSKDCPICFERPINCVLYQCGHMCTCYECGVKQWKTQSRTCPICRTVIKDVIKTYMS